jgi:hypothetical protein
MFVRRASITVGAVCVVAMVLEAWRSNAPNLLVWQLIVAVAVGVGVATVPWVVRCSLHRVEPRRLIVMLVVTIGSGALLGLLVIAATLADNAAHPVPWPIGTIAVLLPFALLDPRFVRSRRRVTAVGIAHLAVVPFVLDAARRCSDDDCYPLPLWYGLAGVAGLWVVVTEIAPLGVFPGERADSHRPG